MTFCLSRGTRPLISAWCSLIGLYSCNLLCLVCTRLSSYDQYLRETDTMYVGHGHVTPPLQVYSEANQLGGEGVKKQAAYLLGAGGEEEDNKNQ